MGTTLTEIAQQLKDTDKKVQLIYAFNGTGKTRLSRAFKRLVTPDDIGGEESDDAVLSEPSRSKMLYYNAFTEDLFYWDNDLTFDTEPKLKIQPNTFTDWVLRDQGQDQNIITHFQRYAGDKLTPHFSEDFAQITFSLERGDNQQSGNLKVSKGQESLFIWSVFLALLELAIGTLNEAEPENRDSDQFDQLEHVFIDDPVSSLDENHLMELAVSLASLIKSSRSDLRFIITTHSALFYNVLHNELGLNQGKKREGCYLLNPFEDGSFELSIKYGDSNRSFSYHLHLRQLLEQAVASAEVQRFHFMLLRNLYEKTASFLGYKEWKDLLPGPKDAYFNRIIQFTSHSTLSSETVTEPSGPEKNTVALLLNHLVSSYHFWQEAEPPVGAAVES